MYLSKCKEDKESLILLQSMAQRVTVEQVTSVMESLVILSTIAFLDGDVFHIPFIGDLKIEHLGDNIVKGERDAKLKLELSPSELLKSIIGNAEDNKESELDAIFIEKLLHEMEEKIKE